jgi:hypothetical protein
LNAGSTAEETVTSGVVLLSVVEISNLGLKYQFKHGSPNYQEESETILRLIEKWENDQDEHSG